MADVSAARDAVGSKPILSNFLPRREMLRALTEAAARANSGFDRRALSSCEGDLLALALQASEMRVNMCASVSRVLPGAC